MGIQSTSYIKRSYAIERIMEVARYYFARNTKALDECSGENRINRVTFEETRSEVKKYRKFKNLEFISNDELEDLMDMPYFRHSIFDNYIIDNDNND